MYTLAPRQLLPLCNPIPCKPQGTREGHILRVLNRPRHGHFLSPLNHPCQSRRPSRRFCSGKLTHRQWRLTTSVTDSFLRLLGYSFLSLLPPTILTYHVGICRGSCHPSKCHSWGCRPQGAVAYCPSILRGHILSFPTLDTTWLHFF